MIEFKPLSELKRRPRRDMAAPGECAYCDRMRAQDEKFFPRHDASCNCQSGRHEHCTCDTCF
jgi:hypothetical protein